MPPGSAFLHDSRVARSLAMGWEAPRTDSETYPPFLPVPTASRQIARPGGFPGHARRRFGPYLQMCRVSVSQYFGKNSFSKSITGGI